MPLAKQYSSRDSKQDLINNTHSCLYSPSTIDFNTNFKADLKSDLAEILQDDADDAGINERLSDRKDISHCLINRCIVALGSNFEAEKHLTIARDELGHLTQRQYWSTPFVNPDYTATLTHPKPDYTNQCGYLQLQHSQSLNQLIEITKHIETGCERIVLNSLDKAQSETDCLNLGRVSIDIDVLAVHIVDKWHIIKQRYPFKEHEVVGLNELLED